MRVKEVVVKTHDEFVMRASRIFPPDQAQAWSRLERAVFNSLMSRLIFQRGYAAISDEMLLDLRASMEKLARVPSRAIEDARLAA